MSPSNLADEIDALLPQTQCARCGYPACRPYAEALAAGAAELNRCPPGGDHTISALAGLLGRAVVALDPSCGAQRRWRLARIEENACIGCTLCIDACPVDAILGASHRMHTVIASECTGCELCVAVCPVDCIVLEPMSAPAREVDRDSGEAGFLRMWMRERAPAAAQRYRAREARLARQASARRLARGSPRHDRTAEQARLRADIEAAVARVRARRATRTGGRVGGEEAGPFS